MSRVIVLLVVFLCPASALGALGDHVWSQGWGTGGVASPDGTGHHAAAGSFFSSIDFGGGLMTPGNVLGGDVFLVRLDASGNHVWSQQFTPGGFGFFVQTMTTAPDGSIYLAGALQNGDIDFGGGVLSGNGDVVLAAFEANGSHRWSMLVGPGTVQAIDASNETVAVTGYTYGTMDFGGGPMNSAGDSDIFAAQLRADGSHRWSALFGNASGQGGMGLALDGSEGLVLAATSEADIDFGGDTLLVSGTDLCLAAFDSVGTHAWSFNLAGDFSPGSGILATLDVDVAPDGRIALAGQFDSSVDFGGGNLTAYGGHDVFVALYDATGSHLSSQRYGGNQTDTVQGVRFDSAGNLAMAGTFNSATGDFGGAPLVHSGGFGSDWFAAMFDTAGTHLYSEAWTGSGQYSMAARFSASDQLVLTGSGSGGTDFGGGALSTTQLFVAVLEGEASGTTSAVTPRWTSRLEPNVPNPFNPMTTIHFELETPMSHARLAIFDVTGRLVRTLREGPAAAGRSSVTWDGRDDDGRSLGAGVYIARLEGDNVIRSRKLTLVK